MIKFVPRAFAKPVLVLYSLLGRAMTLGVRAIVQNAEGQILLVRHTYVKGWHFPGGGVERAETLAQAVAKEVREEASILITGAPRLFHVYRNPRGSRFDHVGLFICKDWKPGPKWQPDMEIAEIGFFHLEQLPKDTSPATRRRLSEVFDGNSPSDIW